MELRVSGHHVADGVAIDAAISQLWKAVDRGKLQPFVVGPGRRPRLKLSPEMSTGIPVLRTPRGQDFHFLRPGNRYHKQLVDWFGPDLSRVLVVFREVEVTKLARGLLGARRRRERSGGKKKGRPSRRAEVEALIRDLIDERRWSPTQLIKTLSSLVNRRAKWDKLVSDDTVARCLDDLHADTGDRRFERVRRRAKARSVKPTSKLKGRSSRT
jgi:hypothetical protein